MFIEWITATTGIRWRKVWCPPTTPSGDWFACWVPDRIE